MGVEQWVIDEERYTAVNISDNINELKQAINKIGTIRICNGEEYSAHFHCLQVDKIVDYFKKGARFEDLPFNLVSRRYGIRQQLMYLLFYNKL